MGGVDGRPCAADVVQQQAPAGDQDAPHLADRCDRPGGGAQRQRADGSVERGVAKGQVLGVAFAEVRVQADAGGALPGRRPASRG